MELCVCDWLKINIVINVISKNSIQHVLFNDVWILGFFNEEARYLSYMHDRH